MDRGSISSKPYSAKWRGPSCGTFAFNPGQNSANGYSRGSRRSTPHRSSTAGENSTLWPQSLSLFGVGSDEINGAMPTELDPLAKRQCRPTGGVATASSFTVLVFL